MKKFRYFYSCFFWLVVFPFSGFAQNYAENSSAGASAAENSAGSEPRHEIAVGVGATMSTAPYRNYDTQWMGYPIILYDGPYAYIREFKAGVKIINLDFLEFSVYGGYDGTSFDASDSSNQALKKLKDRHDSAVAGIGAQFKTPYGMLHVSGEGDVLGHSNGFSGAFGYMNSFEYGPVEFVPSVGANWSSSRYNDYYYGISKDESLRSGLDDYSAGDGVSPYMGLTIDYSITDDLEIYCNGQVTFLGNAVKDSPMVSRDTTHSVSMGLMYTFSLD
jgi:outer membrane scaffolding protein for murein synthesis (MipA/OmpV family)